MVQTIIDNVLIKKLIKFFSIGVLSTLIHILVFWALLASNLVSSQLANLVAFLIALAFSFLGQTYVTFEKSPEKMTSTMSLRFLSTAIMGYSINAFWVFFVDNLLKINAQWSIVGIAFFTPVITFILLSKWVYKEDE